MAIPTDEQETVIQIDRNGGATIWTCDSTMITKLDKVYYCNKEDTCDGEVIAKHYKAPKNCISFRSDPEQRPEYTPKKQISAEQVERLHQGRRNKHEAK